MASRTRVSTGRRILVVGAPHFTAIRLVWCVLAAEPSTSVTLLVRPDAIERTETILQKQIAFRSRISVIRGDSTRPGLGLGSTDLFQLRERITDVYHFDALYHVGHAKARVEEVNIGGTRNLIEFARTLRSLNRFNFYSTAFVSGDRSGVVLEDELERGQHFRNTFERTRFTAELEVRRASMNMPVSVFRPSLVVGDSRTGELGPLDGPHYLIGMLANSPDRLPPLRPEAATFPVHLVPVDYVARAMHAISLQPSAEGKTFHLVDSNPVSNRHAFRLVSQLAGTPRAERSAGHWIARMISHVPGADRISSGTREFLHELDNHVLFNSMQTSRALAGTGISCPSFPDYASRLVRSVKRENDGWDGTADDNLS
jgi:thioester reductase-like protein